jgi:hypothetical protein
LLIATTALAVVLGCPSPSSPAPVVMPAAAVPAEPEHPPPAQSAAQASPAVPGDVVLEHAGVVYSIERGDTDTLYATRAGEQPRSVVAGLPGMAHVLVHDGRLLFTTYAQGLPCRFHALPVAPDSASAPVLLAEVDLGDFSESRCPTSAAADGGHLYFTAGRAIRRVPIAEPRRVETLVANAGSPNTLAVFRGNVFWSNLNFDPYEDDGREAGHGTIHHGARGMRPVVVATEAGQPSELEVRDGKLRWLDAVTGRWTEAPLPTLRIADEAARQAGELLRKAQRP